MVSTLPYRSCRTVMHQSCMQQGSFLNVHARRSGRQACHFGPEVLGAARSPRITGVVTLAGYPHCSGWWRHSDSPGDSLAEGLCAHAPWFGHRPQAQTLNATPHTLQAPAAVQKASASAARFNCRHETEACGIKTLARAVISLHFARPCPT